MYLQAGEAKPSVSPQTFSLPSSLGQLRIQAWEKKGRSHFPERPFWGAGGEKALPSVTQRRQLSPDPVHSESPWQAKAKALSTPQALSLARPPPLPGHTPEVETRAISWTVPLPITAAQFSNS